MLSKKRIRELIELHYDRLRSSEETRESDRDTIAALTSLLASLPEDEADLVAEWKKLQEGKLKTARRINISFTAQLDIPPSELEQVIGNYLTSITLYDEPLDDIEVIVQKVLIQ